MRPTFTSRGLAVLVVAVIGIAACSDDPDSADIGAPASLPSGQADDTTTTEASDGLDAGRQYLDLLATEDLSRMGGMTGLAAAGSPAALYATHQIAAVRASGIPRAPTDVEVDGDSIVLCQAGLDASGNQTEQCNTYADFTVDGDRLASFTIDGTPVSDRIRAGDPAGTSADGVTARIVTAYQTARGDLALNIDITNGRDTALAVADYDWAFVTADGRQVAPSELFAGPAPQVEPGATAGHVVYFEQAPLGGSLRIVAFADDFATEVRFELGVPA